MVLGRSPRAATASTLLNLVCERSPRSYNNHGKHPSENQPLTTTGDTPSTGWIDLAARGAPSLVGQCIAITSGGITFAGNGLLQVVLQSSLNGSSCNDHGEALTPLMGFSTVPALQVLARRNLPALGGARCLRLVYRVSGAVPTGAISAVLETAPADRFKYGRSGF
ncbi:MAG: hypothetical protein EON93_06390 [Burkholderiales bacterium]|nr:MAG: hypothetical protein EON93_06390 [Burkholderiales bacterium]